MAAKTHTEDVQYINNAVFPTMNLTTIKPPLQRNTCRRFHTINRTGLTGETTQLHVHRLLPAIN